MVIFDTVTKKYEQNITALEDVCFRVDQGEFCFVVGPSGAGKSTIMRLLIKEELPTSGSIFFNDIEVPKLTRKLLPTYRQKLGVVFQDIKLLQTKTLEENIQFALEILDKSPKEIIDTTDYLLELVDLKNRRHLFPEQLSGGEQQRGAIARALANNPDLFLADEPTGNLDTENGKQILEILKRINSQGTTVMVITHDDYLVNGHKSRTITIKNGILQSDSDPKDFKKKYVPVQEEIKDEDIVKIDIPGETPKPDKTEKKEIKSPFTNLSEGLQDRLKKFSIKDEEMLLGLTNGDLKNMQLSKKENKELEEFVKSYLSTQK
jgi:cell division transport system ATP-binding protein